MSFELSQLAIRHSPLAGEGYLGANHDESKEGRRIPWHAGFHARPYDRVPGITFSAIANVQNSSRAPVHMVQCDSAVLGDMYGFMSGV